MSVWLRRFDKSELFLFLSAMHRLRNLTMYVRPAGVKENGRQNHVRFAVAPIYKCADSRNRNTERKRCEIQKGKPVTDN